MPAKSVLLTTIDRCANIFYMYFSQYPTKNPPSVGDELLLRSQTVKIQYSIGANESEYGETVELSGKYIVTRVIEGKGIILIPELADGSICTLSKDVEGFGVQIRKERDLKPEENPIFVSSTHTVTYF